MERKHCVRDALPVGGVEPGDESTVLVHEPVAGDNSGGQVPARCAGLEVDHAERLADAPAKAEQRTVPERELARRAVERRARRRRGRARQAEDGDSEREDEQVPHHGQSTPEGPLKVRSPYWTS